MKKIFVLCLALICTNSFANVCNEIHDEKSSLNFRVNYGTPVVYTISPQSLIQKTGRDKTVGLTEANAQMIYKITTSVVWKDGVICVYPKDFDVEYGYEKLIIYYADKYKKNSCAYKEIIKHENEHVDIFQNELARYAPLLEIAIKKAISELKPIRIKSENEVNKATNYFMYQLDTNKEILHLKKENQNEIERKNAKLDEHENYLEVLKKCNDWY
ncbi:MAG: hypothetical protein LBR35_00900 [Rickettsiales bacterium]|jgi:hypothetical protein|nr:hypothetical protein [Rickettsiales bacterium]